MWVGRMTSTTAECVVEVDDWEVLDFFIDDAFECV